MQNWQQRLKGDRTMARSFSIMDIMSDASKAETVTETVEKISIWDIQPNQDNFYQLCNIEQLKSSIYAMGGVQQNIVVTKLPAGEKFKYKLLAGHRRTLACVELVQEGHKEFELIPAVIKNHATSDEEEMLLLMTNSTQRELSDYEKVIQHMKLKKLIPKLKRRDNIPGKVRSLEAEFMNVSEAQIGIYNTIGTRLEADLMELFAKDEIGISLAYEIAKLSSVDQIKLIDVYLQNGRLTDEDVKYLVNNKPIAGQTKLDDIVTEKVSDSDTLEQTAAEEKVLDSDTFEEPDIDYSVEENVSDSDTSEEPDIEYSVEENEPEADNIEVSDIEFSVEENVSDSDTFEEPEKTAHEEYIPTIEKVADDVKYAMCMTGLRSTSMCETFKAKDEYELVDKVRTALLDYMFGTDKKDIEIKVTITRKDIY